MSTYDKTINTLYENPKLKTNNITQRIEIISAYFLGKPYLIKPLGEGPSAPFDQAPLYRTDGFDCLTYVSTVLALAKARNLMEFKQKMLEIQYYNATPTFENRLHFLSVDWNINNQKNGFIEDITRQILPSDAKNPSLTAYATINKPAWYQTSDHLNLLQPLLPKEKKERLKKLHHLSQQVKIEQSALPYIPLTALFDSHGKANQTIFSKIPSGAIIEIVRPNWNLVPQIGTHLNVSHLGFAIRTPEGLMFREASSADQKKFVMDISLIAYLKNYLGSPTVKGINIERILPNSAIKSSVGE